MATSVLANNIKHATFGAGCFWCVDAVFRQLKGVEKCVPGYAGGHTENPTYKQVCGGDTGHAEVCQVTFNPSQVSFADLLEVFWKTHNPTTLNRQGEDVGTQYRSVIFYHDDEQKDIAYKSKSAAEEAKLWSDPIVTEIVPLTKFWEAEEYHHDYFNRTPENPYCSVVVGPKVSKFQKLFRDRLKASADAPSA